MMQFEVIPYSDSNWTPEQVAAATPQVNPVVVELCGSRAGDELRAKKQRQERKAAHRIAALGGPPVLLHRRPDTVWFDERSGWIDAGWDPRFPRRMSSRDLGDVWDSWMRAGWKIDAGLTPWSWDVLRALAPDVPVPYASADEGTKTLTVVGVVLNLSDPKARQFWVRAAVRDCAIVGTQGRLHVGAKWSFWANPQTDRMTPDHLIGGSGHAITGTPFGPGEFEAGMRALSEESADAGLQWFVRNYPRTHPAVALLEDWPVVGCNDRIHAARGA